MQNILSPTICLASSSPYRRSLLDRILSKYKILAPNIDESEKEGLTPKKFVSSLAYKKAIKVRNFEKDSLIIGADQLAVLDNKILNKPGNYENAFKQLSEVSGRIVTFLTAVCILDPKSNNHYEFTDVTKTKFRKLNNIIINNYLSLDKPYNCAGSFKIEGAGFILFDSIKTNDPTALIGLPMIWLTNQLLELGYLKS
ncbi:MAG: septum formation protein Maf [Woeseia sp.]|nr:septum formation protein Maf [Woeseia sp.]|tara:strand:+ start:18610 stop:19203 length:594 start_codon:yes stop_codon:yes gene_type:complete